MVNDETLRTCKACGDEKPIKAFRKFIGGYRSRACGACLDKADRERYPERHRRRAAIKRQRRPDSACLTDCRASDRKSSRPGNDLDIGFVAEQLAQGCSYCGEKAGRITLDRIDNALAHTKANVVPACLRCNYMRGSMPHAAWMHLVPSVRQARDLGLFGDWRTTTFNRKHVVDPTTEMPPPAARPRRHDAERTNASRKRTTHYGPTFTKSDLYPSVEDVRARVAAASLRRVAKELGCSHVAVWKYIRKLPVPPGEIAAP